MIKMTELNKRCLQPHWKVIQDMCKRKIEAKHPKYGNSWKTTWSYEFWNQRLQSEVDEVKIEYSDNRIDELIDVINVCAMQISNLLDSKQHEMVAIRLGI